MSLLLWFTVFIFWLVGAQFACMMGVPVEILPELAMVGDSLSRISLVMHCFEIAGWGGCCMLVWF